VSLALMSVLKPKIMCAGFLPDTNPPDMKEKHARRPDCGLLPIWIVQ
jgi:hypothetical protein